jgi:hypothetical protein
MFQVHIRILREGRRASRVVEEVEAEGAEEGEGFKAEEDGAEESGRESGSAVRGEVAWIRGSRAEVAELVRVREAEEVPRDVGIEWECLCFDESLFGWKSELRRFKKRRGAGSWCL